MEHFRKMIFSIKLHLTGSFSDTHKYKLRILSSRNDYDVVIFNTGFHILQCGNVGGGY